MEISGLPLHPLIVHAVVALVPAASVAAVLMVVVPPWRWLARWAAPLLAAAAVGATLVARESGEDLLASRTYPAGSPALAQLRVHQDAADLLLWWVVALAVLVALAVWLLPASTPLRSGRWGHAARGPRWVQWLVAGAAVVLAGLALVWVVLTGDAGARSVWGA